MRETLERVDVYEGPRRVATHRVGPRTLRYAGDRSRASAAAGPGTALGTGPTAPRRSRCCSIEPRLASYVHAFKQQIGERRAPLRRLLSMLQDYPREAFLAALAARRAVSALRSATGSRRWCCEQIADDYFVLPLRPGAPTMNEDLEQLLLRTCKLKTIAARFDEMLAAAEAERHARPEVARAAAARRVARTPGAALTARIKRANYPRSSGPSESFPFKLQTGVKERQIRTFAELDFIPKAENIVFIGETGVGKTGLMMASLLKAVQNGYRALFIQAQDLFDEMYASLADRSSRKLLKSLASVDVLAIDELGYLNMKPEQTNIFFKLMEERHHRNPTIITTNLPTPTWHGFLGNRRWSRRS